MKPSLLSHLVCPETGLPLALEVIESEGEEVKTGTLRSAAGTQYPIRNFVPRFVDSDHYAYSFSFQRQLVRRHAGLWKSRTGTGLSFDEDQTYQEFVRSTGFTKPCGGLTLDAGCGYARFLSIADRLGDEFVGVDLSTDTVDLAFEAVGRRRRVHVLQADLEKLPFSQGTFQRIFSIGVLHHTPCPRKVFERLLPKLAAGGEIAIWVYAPQFKKASNRFRRLTTKLPLAAVYAWCLINEAAFAWARSLPVGGGRIGSIIPGGTLATPFWMRVVGDFDDLTPRYAYTYTSDQIGEWFKAAKLVDIEALPRATAMRGRKPQAPGEPMDHEKDS